MSCMNIKIFKIKNQLYRLSDSLKTSLIEVDRQESSVLFKQGKRKNEVATIAVMSLAMAVFGVTGATTTHLSHNEIGGHQLSGDPPQSALYDLSIMPNFAFIPPKVDDPHKDNESCRTSVCTALMDVTTSHTISLPENSDIRGEIENQAAYYRAHQNHIDKSISRAMPILPLIVDKLRAAGLPPELALLPIIESSYQADALSDHNAAGLWQITPTTGKYLGLNRSSVFDGRMDIDQSTDAAIDYLAKLHKAFGNNWTKTLMAYNGGSGTLQKVMAGKVHPTDEMRQYPIRFYALVMIFNQFSMSDINRYNDKRVRKINLEKPISLPKIADLTGVSLSELQRLNPCYKTGLTLGGSWLMVPGGDTLAFTNARIKTAEHAASRWHLAKMKKKRHVKEVARDHHCSTEEIMAMNRIDSSVLQKGDEILVP